MNRKVSETVSHRSKQKTRNMLMSVHKAGKVSKKKKKKKKATLLMDFQKLKIPRVTDFWPEKVTCRLNVLPPFREGEMTEQHVFFFFFFLS